MPAARFKAAAAPGKRWAISGGVTGRVAYHSVYKNTNQIEPTILTSELASRLATVLRVMLSQPCLRQALALLERRAFGNRQSPQTGQIAAARARLAEFLGESLTFETI